MMVYIRKLTPEEWAAKEAAAEAVQFRTRPPTSQPKPQPESPQPKSAKILAREARGVRHHAAREGPGGQAPWPRAHARGAIRRRFSEMTGVPEAHTPGMSIRLSGTRRFTMSCCAIFRDIDALPHRLFERQPLSLLPGMVKALLPKRLIGRL